MLPCILRKSVGPNRSRTIGGVRVAPPSRACLEKGRYFCWRNCCGGSHRANAWARAARCGGRSSAPSIIWCDQRTGKQCEQITQRIGAERLIELTANPALTNFTLPKIWWVQQHEPEIWSRARTILLPKDYFRFRLTGARAIDVAEASGTLFFDVLATQVVEAHARCVRHQRKHASGAA